MISTPALFLPRRAAALALLLAALGLASPACAQDTTEASGAKAAAAQPETAASVVAEVGGKPITLAELEASMAPQLEQLERQKRKLLEEGLLRLVEERLLEAEATARGTDVESMVQAEIAKAGGEVTDEEAAAFYEQNKARMGGRTLEQIQPQIKSYLAGQRVGQARETLVASLRSKHATRILLEPDRAPVEVGEGSPSKGPADAPVTIVEFSDFQCPFCSRVNPAIEETLKTYGDQVRVVFRQYPLSIHPQAQKAAEASLCANDQGKFWELHDAMFADQRNLAVETLKAKATELGLDAAAFGTCLDSGKYAEKVAEDMNHGISVGVNGTPAIFVNGRFLSGAVPFSEIAKLVDDELSRKGIESKRAAS